MTKALLGNRNEDAESRFLGVSVYNAYGKCRQRLAVSAAEERVYSLLATKSLRFLQAKAIIHYAASSMRPEPR